jgi:hypothetical protein
LSVAIKICSLACFYNLKANRNKRFEVYPITPYNQSVKCGSGSMYYDTFPHPLSRNQFFMGHVTSPTPQPGFSSTRNKREKPGNEVDMNFDIYIFGKILRWHSIE